jgi:uncharacterized protein
MLQQTIDWLTYSVIGMNAESKVSQSINYFIYDSIKIIFLLFFLIWVIGFLRSYVSQKKVKEILSGKKEGIGNFFAAVFGAVTPFCSCSSIPIFMSFLRAGVPLGITFSFLITSPIINEYLVVLMWGFFGWKIAVAYVISGMVLGTIVGIVLGRMKLEKHLVKDFQTNSSIKEEKYKNLKERIAYGLNEASSLVRKLWIWIIVAVAIGAIIHNYVPQELIEKVVSATGFFAVPIATIIGVPLYGGCAAIVPIAVELFNKGVPIGTALSFMMATAALSFPEAILLRRAMKLRLILIFFGIVTLGIIFTGYLLNYLQPFLV